MLLVCLSVSLSWSLILLFNFLYFLCIACWICHGWFKYESAFYWHHIILLTWWPWPWSCESGWLKLEAGEALCLRKQTLLSACSNNRETKDQGVTGSFGDERWWAAVSIVCDEVLQTAWLWLAPAVRGTSTGMKIHDLLTVCETILITWRAFFVFYTKTVFKLLKFRYIYQT